MLPTTAQKGVLGRRKGILRHTILGRVKGDVLCS